MCFEEQAGSLIVLLRDTQHAYCRVRRPLFDEWRAAAEAMGRFYNQRIKSD